MKLEDACTWKKNYEKPRQHNKKQRHYFAYKGLYSKSYGFSSSHVWMWELDHKESWVPKNWFFWTVVLEKTLESPLYYKGIKPVSPKGNQSWVFIGRTDAETEAPTLWPLDGKNWHIGKHLDSGKDWRQEEKGITEDEMVGWHHRLDEHESEQALGVWWWVAKPGVLQSIGSQRVGRDWVTELNWTSSSKLILHFCWASCRIRHEVTFKSSDYQLCNNLLRDWINKHYHDVHSHVGWYCGFGSRTQQ